MDVRIVLLIFLIGGLNLSQKTLPSAHRYEITIPKDNKSVTKSATYGRASVNDFTKQNLMDLLAASLRKRNTDSILPDDSSNDTLKAESDVISQLLNRPSDKSGHINFDIQEGIKELNKIKSDIQHIQDGLRKKLHSKGQRVNNKNTERHTTYSHRDFEENQTVHPTSLGLSIRDSKGKISDIQVDSDSQFSNDLDKDVDAQNINLSDGEYLMLSSEDPLTSESKTSITLKTFHASTITESSLNRKTERFSSIESTYKPMDQMIEYGSENKGTRRNKFHSQLPYYSTLSEKNDVVPYMTKQEVNLSEKHSSSSDTVGRKFKETAKYLAPVYKESLLEENLKKENILPRPFVSLPTLLYGKNVKGIGNDVHSTRTFDKMFSGNIKNRITDSYSVENTDEGTNMKERYKLHEIDRNFVLYNGNYNKFVEYDIDSSKMYHEMIEKLTKGVTEIYSPGDTTENISSTNIEISPLVFRNINKGEQIDQLFSHTVIPTGDTELSSKSRLEPYKIYIEDYAIRSEKPLMDSTTETSLPSMDDKNTEMEFTETSTNTARPPVLISTFPTLDKILRERGSSDIQFSHTVISKGDTDSPSILRQEPYKIYIEDYVARSEEPPMDSTIETSLPSLDDKNAEREFTETSTSAAMHPVLISTYPTLDEILRERGNSVALHKSVTNCCIKDTSELTTSTLPYTSERSLLDVILSNVHGYISIVSEQNYVSNTQTTNPVVPTVDPSVLKTTDDANFQNNGESDTESTMTESFFSNAEEALKRQKKIFQCFKHFFAKYMNPAEPCSKLLYVEYNMEKLVHEEETSSPLQASTPKDF